MRDAMARRGPDGEGLWTSGDGRVGLAHRRLAIIDLSAAAAQPMATADGRFRIIFNGEIYNYRGLQRVVADRGHRLETSSDTEVLLHLYREFGHDMLPMLRGMFTFAIWDDLEKTLFLARDAFGIKPLYYEDNGSVFRFASQVKALVKGGGIDTTPSAAGHTGFFLWGHLPDPYTLYKSVKAVPAGSSVLVTSEGARPPRRFFSIRDEFERVKQPSSQVAAAEVLESVHAALKDSVSHHLVSDVPVGVFLSSGLDSTTITALASETGIFDRLHTLTLGFKEYKGGINDEVPLARLAAEACGTRHTTSWISREDFERELPSLIEAMDQPTIDGVNTYFVSKAAAASGMKVALSGLGGDELFRGYPSFKEIPKLVGAMSPFRKTSIGRAFRRISSPLIRPLTSPKFAGLVEYGGDYAGAYLLRRGLFMPWELPEVLDPAVANEGLQELDSLLNLRETYSEKLSPTQRVSALELSWYMKNQLLRDSDWAGMAHSVEIRVPFVDVELFRTIAPLTVDGEITKDVVARSPAKPLPAPLLKRRKTGFSVPIRDWLPKTTQPTPYRRGLRSWARVVNPHARPPRRIIALATDAFGGHGGIAKFNRDLLTSLATDPRCKEVVLLPRLIPGEVGTLPPKVRQVADAARSKVHFVLSTLREVALAKQVEVVVCCHVNLLPLAYVASLVRRAPLILFIHGIDAWQPTRNRITNLLSRQVHFLVSVSNLTLARFERWAQPSALRSFILPNCVDLSLFDPKPKDPELVRRFRLQGKRVLMTMGRLVSAERYKGFDEVLELLPELRKELPNLVYLIVGDGTDRERLEKRARDLGIADCVVFTGFIAEAEKCAIYNLADVYVMPSRGEGFGIVFLEAMACGVPVIGSTVDGSREALLNGELGTLVNPDEPEEIRAAIFRALDQPKRVPVKLNHFSFDNFERRVHEIVQNAVS